MRSVSLALLLVVCGASGCYREPWAPDVTTAASPGSHQPPGNHSPEDSRSADGEDADGPDGVADVPTPVVPSAAPIAIDGRFDDWETVPALYVDPTGDAGSTGIDIATVKASHDARFLYLYFETGAEISLANDQYLTLYLDADDDPYSGTEYRGIGAELQWVFGQRGGKVFGGQGVTPVQFADIRFRALPTVTSTRFEVAIGRLEKPGGKVLLPGGTVALVLVDHTWNGQGAEDGDFAPETGEAIRYSLEAPAPEPMAPVSLERHPDAGLRIVSWNSLYTGLLDPERAESFRRILQALQPDILCLQEAWYPADTAELLDEWLPLEEGHWHAVSHGNSITLSRYPFVYGWPGGFALLPDAILVTGIELPDSRRIIVFNAHLAWGDQDEQRQLEADAFIAYLRQMAGPDWPEEVAAGTPFLLVGDLNLVGDAQQLRTLVEGDVVGEEEYGEDHAPDWDGTPLLVPPLLQTEHRMGYTWRPTGGSYWPGLLDYALLSDSVLALHKGFLLYTGEMSQEELAAHGLQDSDSATASDHLPLVLDVGF